jgi:biotin carboxylase
MFSSKNNSYMHKKILILGGNKETSILVDYARKLGFYVVVVDPNKDSPAKRIADESYEIDGFDINGIVSIIKQKEINGILVGVADVLVKPYFEITKKLGFYCYANEDSSIYLTNKSKFRELCINNDVSVIPYFSLQTINSIKKENFPILIKPSDNGAGVGIYIAYTPSELPELINKALINSKSKSVLIEKFMKADDLFAYYTIQNGEVFLSAIADRITYKDKNNKSPVCAIASYPSKHAKQFISNINYKIQKMIKNLKINNGILMIQFFYSDSIFYAYDPGFRLQGEGPDVYLNYLQGIDHKKYLLEFSLSGNFGPSNLSKLIDPLFNNKKAYTIWILLDAGVIYKINGKNELKNRPEIINILYRLDCNDVVTQEMIGTERQVFARIYTIVKNQQEIINLINFIRYNLNVLDEKGRNLIINTYDLLLSSITYE